MRVWVCEDPTCEEKDVHTHTTEPARIITLRVPQWIKHNIQWRPLETINLMEAQEPAEEIDETETESDPETDDEATPPRHLIQEIPWGKIINATSERITILTYFWAITENFERI